MAEIIAQRYYVTPPTEAEMAKALQDEPGTAFDDSAHGQNPVADADEQLWEIGCCGYYLGKRRPH